MNDPIRVTDGDAQVALDVQPQLARNATKPDVSTDTRNFYVEQLRRIQYILLQRTIDLIEEGNTPKALDLLRQLRDAARE